MADTKTTALPASAGLASTDLIPVVDDPAGTPASQKATVAQVGAATVTESAVVGALDGATLTAVTVATGDKVVVQDASDSDNIKTVTAQSIADLASGGDAILPDRTALSITRVDTAESHEHAVTVGPWYDLGLQATMAPNSYYLGISYVPAVTLSVAAIHVSSAGSSGDDVYYALWNMDSSGLPTTVAHSFGPFNVDASTGIIEITGLSETISAGWYWAGALTPSTNTGSPQIKGGDPAVTGPIRVGLYGYTTFKVLSTGDATPQTMAGRQVGTGGTDLTGDPAALPILLGDS